MTQSDIDNDLARLLGPDAIPDEERSSIMARLLADNEALSQAADAAAVLRELEAEDGIVVVGEIADDEPPRVRDAEPAYGPKVVTSPPPSTRRTWRRPPARWMALAAVFVAALLVLPSRFGGRDSSGDFAASFTDRQAGVPTEWAIPGATRGSPTVAADDGLAAYFGALHMELELAVAARQQDRTQQDKTSELSRRIAATLGSVTAGGTVSPIYTAIADSLLPQDSLVQLLTDGREYLSKLVGEEYFALGAWAEAARIAANRQDAAFFRARASRRMLNRAAALQLDSLTRVSVDSLRIAGQADGEQEWARLEDHATQLLSHLLSVSNSDPYISGEQGSTSAVGPVAYLNIAPKRDQPPSPLVGGSHYTRVAPAEPRLLFTAGNGGRCWRGWLCTPEPAGKIALA